MPEKKNSQTGNFLSWLFKKHFLKLEIIFTPTIDKEPKKEPILRSALLSLLDILAMTYSPTKRIRSTIGAGGLNFCVRDGNRCDPSAITTRISILFFRNLSQGSLKTTQCITSFFPTFLFLWSSPRLISISQLNVSLHLHT